MKNMLPQARTNSEQQYTTFHYEYNQNNFNLYKRAVVDKSTGVLSIVTQLTDLSSRRSESPEKCLEAALGQIPFENQTIIKIYAFNLAGTTMIKAKYNPKTKKYVGKTKVVDE